MGIAGIINGWSKAIAWTALVAAPVLAQAEEKTMAMKKTASARSGHIEAHGVNYYYEIHGTGSPSCPI